MMDLSTIEYEANDVIVNEVDVADKEGRMATRSRIDSFEKVLQDVAGSEHGEMDEVNGNGLKQYFVDGSYIRELLIPRDMAVVSEIWKKERMWIIATGEVTFTTEMGTKRVIAPHTEVVPPGSKVALYTHEETLWFAITGAGDVTTEDEIREEVMATGYDDVTYPWDDTEEQEK